MAIDISRYVNIDLARQTGLVGVGSEKFNIDMILVEHTRTANRVDTFSSPDDMLVTGSLFTATDAAYLKAVALYSQDQTPLTFKVGKKDTDANAKQTITFSTTPDAGAFTVKLGAAESTSIGFGDALTVIETAIEATTGITSVTVTGAVDATTGLTIEFDGADANTAFETLTIGANTLTTSSVAVVATITTIQHGSAVDSWTEALNAVFASDPNFYFLNADTKVESEIKELSAIIETKKNVYITTTDEAGILTATASNTLADLKALARKRTSLIWAFDSSNHADSALTGIGVPKKPGTLNYEVKPISGVIAGQDANSTPFTTTQVTNLDAQNGVYVETIGKGPSVINAKMVNGDFLDIQRLEDKIDFEVKASVFALLQNSQKVPGTQAGIDLVEQAIRTPLDQLVIDGAIKDGFSIVMPKIDSVSDADLSARLLQNITANPEASGAFNTFNIKINYKV